MMRTERVMMYMTREERTQALGFARRRRSASAALAGDRDVQRFGGTVVFVADLARTCGFTDVDGRQPERFNPFGGRLASFLMLLPRSTSIS